MEKNFSIRWGWLKAMYIYTIIGAGGFGLGVLLFPGTTQSVLRFPPQDPFILGLYGCVSLASGLLAIPALRSPLKFAPLLLLQVVYKPLWLLAVVIPGALKGQFSLHVAFITIVHITYVIGNLIAIPFPYLFSKKEVAS
jgi:hypothetical protein